MCSSIPPPPFPDTTCPISTPLPHLRLQLPLHYSLPVPAHILQGSFCPGSCPLSSRLEQNSLLAGRLHVLFVFRCLPRMHQPGGSSADPSSPTPHTAPCTVYRLPVGLIEDSSLWPFLHPGHGPPIHPSQSTMTVTQLGTPSL